MLYKGAYALIRVRKLHEHLKRPVVFKLRGQSIGFKIMQRSSVRSWGPTVSFTNGSRM
jgi:hypothetical protein